MSELKEIKVNELNKYKIVSKLREYKHQILDLTPQEFDIILPQIKSYIYRVNLLKSIFLEKINIYDETIKSQNFKNKINNFKRSFLKSNQIYLVYVLEEFINSSIINITEYKITDENFSHYYSDIDDLLFRSFCDFFTKRASSQEEYDNITDFLREIFYCIGNLIAFKIVDAEENIRFFNKKTNYIKIATYDLLSRLEKYVLNGGEKVKEIRKQYSIDSLSPQEQRVYDYVLDLKKQGKTEVCLDDIINKANIKAKDKKRQAQNIISSINTKTSRKLQLSEFDSDEEKYNIL